LIAWVLPSGLSLVDALVEGLVMGEAGEELEVLRPLPHGRHAVVPVLVQLVGQALVLEVFEIHDLVADFAH